MSQNEHLQVLLPIDVGVPVTKNRATTKGGIHE